MSKHIIEALTYELEETRLAIKKAIKMSDDKTAVHHLHGTVKSIEKMLEAVYEEFKELRIDQEQLELGNYIETKADHKKYLHWLLTVGQLKERLRFHSNDTFVKISIRYTDDNGRRIDVIADIENIGNSKTVVDGEMKDLIYIGGVEY